MPAVDPSKEVVLYRQNLECAARIIRVESEQLLLAVLPLYPAGLRLRIGSGPLHNYIPDLCLGGGYKS